MKAITVCLVALVLWVARPAPAPQESSAGKTGAIRRALDEGAYAAAEAQAATWLAETEQSHGPDSIESARAIDLLVEALIRNGSSAASRTVGLAEHAVHAKEALIPHDPLDLAVSLHNLGLVRDARGEFREALPLHERALTIRRAALPADSTRVADSLDAVARTLIDLGQFGPAQERLDESKPIRDRQSTAAPVAQARFLELVGHLHRQAGRYKDAAVAVDRALEIWNRVAPAHPDKALTLTLRGDIYYLSGESRSARDTWTDALTLTSTTLEPTHPAVARVERALAIGEHSLGNLAESRRLREAALAIGESRLATCHPELTGELNDLALSRVDDGDYTIARRLFRRVRSIREKCLGSKHPSVATAIYNEFTVASQMGSLQDAAALGYEAVRVWSDALGPTHPFVAFGTSELAAFEASRKRYTRAQTLFRQALEIRKQTLGARHPDVALTLTDLADMLGKTSRITSAFTSIHQAIDILSESPSRDPDLLGRALAVRGSLERRSGDVMAAGATYREALAQREKTFGPSHWRTAGTRADIASVDFALASYDGALSSSLSAEESGRDLLRSTIQSLPERQAMDFAAKRPRGLDLALSIAASGHASGDRQAATLLDAMIRSRGVVLDELAARALHASTIDSDAATLTTTLSVARTRLANLTLRSAQGESVPFTILADAKKLKEDAEEALAERSAATRTELTRARMGLDDVRQALPAASALVSFAQYDRTTFSSVASRTMSRVATSYLAFVLQSDASTPTIVPIGPAASVDAAVTAWRKQLDGAATESAYRTAGSALRARIWDPVAPHLKNVSQIFIVPDGAIGTVSFAALPTGDNAYLVERAPGIHYLTSERDLVASGRPPAGTGLLAIGGAEYGRRPEPSTGAGASLGCARGRLGFDDLPGSLDEIRDIASLWGQGADVLTGRAATKDAMIRRSSGHRIVHLATHGFFLDSPCDPGRANTRGVGGLVAASSRAAHAADNPLLLSGLAFAGANRSVSSRGGAVNAILTAEEAVALNLQDTEWVVLSACDTGLGAITAGEGVFGLRRALQIAGARTVIMSLWSVEDRSTRRWMRTLYEGRLRRHMTTTEAVRAAGLRMLRERRAHGESTHPFYWAAFVAAGDWR